MKIDLSRALLLCLIIVGHSSQVYSQVTIGSGAMPKVGALLDLKENDSPLGGATSSKGLMLPRVTLTQKNDLFPMFEGDSEYKGNYKIDADKKHIGLTVFNVNKVEVENNRLCPGVHAWNGKEWAPLKAYPDHSNSSSPEVVPSPHPIIMVDGSQNKYTANFFGESKIESGSVNMWSCDPSEPPVWEHVGLYWTTQNIYATKHADGTPISLALVNIGYQESAVGSQLPEKVWRLTDGVDINTITQTTNYEYDGQRIEMKGSDFIKKFGVAYAGEDANKVCDTANGWRLPTYQDWSSFKKYYFPEEPGTIAKPFFPLGSHTWGPNSAQTDPRTYSYVGNDSSHALSRLSTLNALPAGTITYDKTIDPHIYRSDGFGNTIQWWMQDFLSGGLTYNGLYNFAQVIPGNNLYFLYSDFNSSTSQFHKAMHVRCVKDYVAKK